MKNLPFIEKQPHFDALAHYNKKFLTIFKERFHTKPELGRGAHYWIVRYLQSYPVGTTKDLAIIWDEDHDERIFELLGALHANKVINNVLFIGERKGSVTIILEDEDTERSQYRMRSVRECVDSEYITLSGDIFKVNIQIWGEGSNGIIKDDDKKVACYLEYIKAMWNLGVAL